MKSRWVGLFLSVATAFIVSVALRGFMVAAPRSQNVPPPADVRGQWESVGPLPYVRNAFLQRFNPELPFSGRISSIAVDPTDLNHWLLGVGFGGVWETRDAGASWTPLTDGAPTLATGDIAFDPTNPQTIYVGTGEAASITLGIGGVGILKSTDGGQTWAIMGAASFARGAVKRLRVNPANPRELVAASTRGAFGRQLQSFPPSPPPYGVLRSSDAGQTWVRALAGQATALEIDPANFNRQYAAVGERDVSQTAGADVNGVYRSTDAGQHWTLIAGPWGASSPTQLAAGNIELALAPSNANTVYASIAEPVANNAKLLGLYRTDNAWDDVPTWRQISTTPGSYCVNCESHVISVDPSDPNIVFAGGKSESLWRCANCSSTPQWTNLSQSGPDTHVDQRALAWAGNRLIMGNDGGVFSKVGGASWQNHNSPTTIQTTMFYNGALHPTDPGFMIGGGRDRGVMVRRGTSVWTEVPRPQNTPQQGTGIEWAENEVALSSRHPETDWMTSVFSGNAIYRTTDGGTYCHTRRHGFR